MQPSIRAARRAAIALALSGATVLSVTAASAAVRQPAAQRSIPKCQTGRLQVWIGYPGDGVAGGFVYPIEFSNISGRRCRLFGFPGVSARNGRGRQLGNAAGRDRTFRPRRVVLAPGGTAHALLKITDVGVFTASACRPRNAVVLRVFPPGRHRAAQIPFSFRACSRRGPVYLHIRMLRRGVGIPGFSQ